MFHLGWIFLCLITGESVTGFNISGCATQKFLWTYSAKNKEEFVLFCNLTETRKSQFYHRRSRSPALGPERLPCLSSKDLSEVQWFLQSQNKDTLREITKNYSHIILDKIALRFLTTEVNHAGSYICRPRTRSPGDEVCCMKMVLEVKPKTNVSCVNPVPHKQNLILGTTDSIYCPSLGCQSDARSPEMTWYQDGRLLPERRSNPIRLSNIYDSHQGTYTCDYTQSGNESSWTVRAVVHVRTVVESTTFIPDILEPVKDVLEVELGQPLTLNCKVRFGFEKNFEPVIRWYSKDSDQELEIPTAEGRSVTATVEGEVIECVVHIAEVTQSYLHKTFICFAQNSIGNTTRSIQLREKKGVVFLYALLGTVVTLAGVLTAGALLFKHWTEIVLLCRTYQNKDETLGDKKEFDAFVSYAKWSSSESEATSSVNEENLALSLFPDVLENKYGYTLCLLERDVAPGGVYAEDVVNNIKKSRRGIFILSPNYVNGPSVFELQAAVNLALDDRTLKLILIKFCSFREPESLPPLVRKALRVLPTVTWRGSKSVPPNSRFWTQIRYHMPVKSSTGLAGNHLRIISRIFSLERLGKTETAGRSSQPGEGGAGP